MLCSDWEKEFNYQVRYLMHKYKDSKNQFNINNDQFILRSLEILNDFDKEFYTKHHRKPDKKTFTIRYREFDHLCKKYIKLCQYENNHIGGYIFFMILEDLRPNFKVESSRFIKNNGSNFLIELDNKHKYQANKYLNLLNLSTTNSNNIKLLKFKGIQLYVYNNIAYNKFNKKLKIFNLNDNWWFDIEKFIYTEKGWGKEGIHKIKLF